MINHDCPVIDADCHLRQLFFVPRNFWNIVVTAGQVVTPVSQRAARKRDIRHGLDRRAQLFAQQSENILSRMAYTGAIADFRLFTLRNQCGNGLGHENIKTSTASAVQPRRPRQIADCGEVGAGVSVVRERGAIQHQ